MKHIKLITVDREDSYLISDIEAYGNYYDTVYRFNKHESYDIYEYNDKYYRIYFDSKKVGGFADIEREHA